MSSTALRQQGQFSRETVEDENILACLLSRPLGKNEVSQLRQLTHNEIQQFSDPDSFVNFATDWRTQKKLYWIVDENFGNDIIPLIHDAPYIDCIYILDDVCDNQWTRKYSKIKKITSSLESIKNMIEEQMTINERKLVGISIFNSTSNDHLPNLTVVDRLDPAFMYSQVLKDIILDTNFKERDKKEFFEFVRERHANNNATQEKIKNLENNYKQYTPAWW